MPNSESPVFCRCSLPHNSGAVLNRLSDLCEEGMRAMAAREATATERGFYQERWRSFLAVHRPSSFTPMWYERTIIPMIEARDASLRRAVWLNAIVDRIFPWLPHQESRAK